MSGFFADGDLTPNRIERARVKAAAGSGYIDLTSSNPTHQGLLFPAEILHSAANSYWYTRRYEPDSLGLRSAREAIVQYYTRRTPQLAVSTDDVFITASTSEAYGLLFALLAEPGDNILAPAVSYPLFEYLAAVYHLELRAYDLDESNGWQIDGDSLLTQIDERTRAILVVSPHNPTGAIVRTVQNALGEAGLPVICDEVFAEFTYQVPHTPPLGALHPTLPIFHLNGISKLLALPDLKLGWIALSGSAREQYGARLELLNDTFLGANTLTQTMLPTLLEKGWPFVETMRAHVRKNLDIALGMLGQVASVRVQPPDGGYYLFPRILGWRDEEELVVRLLDHGVLVHPGYFYGYERGTHLMLSCLTETTQLMTGVERLIAGLDAVVG